MQTSLPQRAFSHSNRILKRARGHPRQWPAAVMPVVPPPAFPVASVQPLPSGWSAPMGASPTLPFRVRCGLQALAANGSILLWARALRAGWKIPLQFSHSLLSSPPCLH